MPVLKNSNAQKMIEYYSSSMGKSAAELNLVQKIITDLNASILVMESAQPHILPLTHAIPSTTFPIGNYVSVSNPNPVTNVASSTHVSNASISSDGKKQKPEEEKNKKQKM